MHKNYLQIYFQKKGNIKSLWVAAGNGDRKDKGLGSQQKLLSWGFELNSWSWKRECGMLSHTDRSLRKGIRVLSVLPLFWRLFFLKGIVSLSIDRPTEENTCRVELHFLKQSRGKNRTGHQISHVFLWFLSTGYWLILHKPKSCGARDHMLPLY